MTSSYTFTLGQMLVMLGAFVCLLAVIAWVTDDEDDR